MSDKNVKYNSGFMV